MNKTIALLTDFGLSDIYVGVMKGEMRGICPEAHFIDITHHIQPQNVRQAAFALLNSYRYFPVDTIFLVVVDPGVGSARRALAAHADGFHFLAPDNGVLSYVLHERESIEIVEISNSDYALPDNSDTFHGRDIFAPAAAHLAAGVPLASLGDAISDPIMLPAPELAISGQRVVGEVVHIDHFGNVVTSVGQLRWTRPERLALEPRMGSEKTELPIQSPTAHISVGGTTLIGICHHYSEAGRGDLLAMVGSNGYLEIAVNQGSAAARLDVTIGDRIELQVE